jgi:hypothetical protein
MVAESGMSLLGSGFLICARATRPGPFAGTNTLNGTALGSSSRESLRQGSKNSNCSPSGAWGLKTSGGMPASTASSVISSARNGSPPSRASARSRNPRSASTGELVLVGATAQRVQVEITPGERTGLQAVSRARQGRDRAQQLEVEHMSYSCRPDQDFAWPFAVAHVLPAVVGPGPL